MAGSREAMGISVATTENASCETHFVCADPSASGPNQALAIAAQCKLLFSNSDLVQPQNFVQGVDELYVRDGLEGTRRVWRFDEGQLFPGDEIRIYVRQQLSMFHFILLVG